VKIGDLVRLRGRGPLWLTLEFIDNNMLAINIKTGYKMWSNKNEFEVFSTNKSKKTLDKSASM
jgi:hypothetical protein